MQSNVTNVLITGGAGFVGSILSRLLLQHGFTVLVLDNLSAGDRAQESAEQLSGVGAQIIRADIRDSDAVRATLNNVDAVVHLAAVASVPASFADPYTCRMVNVQATSTLLRSAQEAGVGRVIFASTAAVYGRHPRLPARELDELAPASPYAESKIAGERLCSIASVGGLPCTIFRFFNIYGPGQDPESSYSGVVSRWLSAVAKREEIEVFGDGLQTRDFVSVYDVSRCIHSALTLRAPAAGVYNVGSGIATSLLDLLETISLLYRYSPVVRYLPPREGDVRHSCAAIDEARRVFGFHPEVALKEGLSELVDLARSFTPE